MDNDKTMEKVSDVVIEARVSCHKAGMAWTDVLRLCDRIEAAHAREIESLRQRLEAVVVDDAMVGRAVDAYAAGHFECCHRHMRAALTAALTHPEVA